MFRGDRGGTLRDPFGYDWTVATHKEDVPPSDIERRKAEWLEGVKGGKS